MSQGAGTSSKGTIVFPIDVVPLAEAKKSDRIAGAIKRWIVDQDLKTGDRLPPAQDLAPLFGCGKGNHARSAEIAGSAGANCHAHWPQGRADIENARLCAHR